MRVALLLALSLFLGLSAANPTARAEGPKILSRPPQSPDPTARYVFYLHGLILEGEGRQARHPQYGVYQYDAVLEALARRGAVVISEIRKPGKAVRQHARRTIAHITALRDAGVPDQHITVVGFSKGGSIARHISATLAAPIRYVLLAACPAPDARPRKATPLHGEVWSVRERSDAVPSCAPLFERSKPAAVTREMVVDIGGSHGAFYRPHPSWLKHVLALVHAPVG